MLQFENISIEVPWGQVVGRWYGNRKVRPILALHGWMDNLGTWDRLIPLLPDHVGILCLDLPGHGASSKLPLGITYHVLDYVHIIIRVVKEYKWRKVSLMAHSMGAIVSFHYTVLYPHMVDMLILVDLITNRIERPDDMITEMNTRVEKLLIEEERMEQWHYKPPPCYSYEELEEAVYRGTYNSLAKENCKYLLNRNITRAEQHPAKFYFSRDPRIKYNVRTSGDHNLALEMAKRVRNIPVMIVRGDKLSFMRRKDEDIVQIFKTNNPHFEYHRIKDGTHHLHVNQAEEVAAFINPFICRHRPVLLDTWTVDNTTSGTVKSVKSKL